MTAQRVRNRQEERSSSGRPTFPPTFPRAEALTREHGVAFWDAMILAACLDAGVQMFYSEDQPGLSKIGALRIVNPFAEEAGTA